MKVKEVIDKLQKMVEENPQSLNWDIFLEAQDLYTFNESLINDDGIINEEMIEHNKKVKHRVKEETKSYWKFITVKEDDTTQYYKECFGGISIFPEKNAVLFSIHC